MIQRCTNPNNKAYKNYGGRGITVCERWRDFTNFLADMEDIAEMYEIYGRYFSGNKPARATVQAARLPRDAKAEIDCIAVV